MSFNIVNMQLLGINRCIAQRSLLPNEARDGDWRDCAFPVTVRERVIIVINTAIKDKPDWENKVFDDNALQEWKLEAFSCNEALGTHDQDSNVTDAGLEHAQSTAIRDAVLDMKAPRRQQVVTEALFQYCIDELRDQAADSKANGFTEVLEANAAIYISDSIISEDTHDDLRSGVAPLEAAARGGQGWRVDGKTLDIIDPSLFPLVYGTSQIMYTRKVPLRHCSKLTGLGETFPAIRPASCTWMHCDEVSTKYQWLPCEVTVGPMGGAKITSYVNNLDPETHYPLYGAIEQVISKAIPMWKKAVQSTVYRYEHLRVMIDDDGYDHEASEAVMRAMSTSLRERRGENSRDSKQGWWAEDAVDNDHNNNEHYGEEKDDEDEDFDNEKDAINAEQWKAKYIRVPDPARYERRERVHEPRRAHYEEGETREPDQTHDNNSDFDKIFPQKGFQVIVKLVNIHLTPDNPTFDGGAPWHIEGLPNEHICATAVYYYDSHNITESHLEFRENVDTNFLAMNTHVDGPEYEVEHEQGLEEIWGTKEQGSVGIQTLGKVLIREGRLIVYSNVLQRKVMPFRLDDATKPGHRKMLAVFLVDPSIRIPSTANVPPQQREWRARAVNKTRVLTSLPQELADKVFDEACPCPLDLEQAKAVREDLLQEKREKYEVYEKRWQNFYYAFNF